MCFCLFVCLLLEDEGRLRNLRWRSKAHLSSRTRFPQAWTLGTTPALGHLQHCPSFPHPATVTLVPWVRNTPSPWFPPAPPPPGTLKQHQMRTPRYSCPLPVKLSTKQTFPSCVLVYSGQAHPTTHSNTSR